MEGPGLKAKASTLESFSSLKAAAPSKFVSLGGSTEVASFQNRIDATGLRESDRQNMIQHSCHSRSFPLIAMERR